MEDAVATLSRHLGPAVLVLARISGLAIFAPVFASAAVPRIVKALLIGMVALAMYPMLAAGALHGAEVPVDLGSIAPLMVCELLIGAVIGFLALMPLVGMQMGGLVMGTQMGLGFARMYNPTLGDEADVLEQIFFFLGLSAFLAVGGHEQMVSAVLRSFHYVQLGGVGTIVSIGGWGVDNSFAKLFTGVLLAATELALRVSAPMVSLFFLETVALGFLSKSVPALNLMSLGFPLRIILGLGVIVLGMAGIGEAMQTFLHADIELLSGWYMVASEH
ncbi:MAG: flagellar biosynthetic protein FliR [Phycisphaerae bacterium]|nr:flagellar biosynthetic protein FliR [Phycisphaerae bacterium]